LIAPYKTFPFSVKKRGSKNALVQILEEQTMIMQQLAERANESSGHMRLSQVGATKANEQLSTPGMTREFQVKLPIIKLPIFNGNIEKWKGNANSFKTLIHNSELSNVQKHQYLIESLNGPAAKIIEFIETSKQNQLDRLGIVETTVRRRKSHPQTAHSCLFELP